MRSFVDMALVKARDYSQPNWVSRLLLSSDYSENETWSFVGKSLHQSKKT